mmetsp:Transcript_5030/g.6108  ORF Transcript_5030/g.6108 Transcript_5030/m.6108 type:complete len:246 (+) Transcript_5030:21-758(+)
MRVPFTPQVQRIDIPSCRGSPVLAQLLQDSNTIPPVKESRFWVRITDSLVQKGLKPNFNDSRRQQNRVTNYQADLLEREILLKLGNVTSPAICKGRVHFPHIFCGDSNFFIQSNVGTPITVLRSSATNFEELIPDDIGEQVRCMTEQLQSVRVRHLDLRCDHVTLSKEGTLGMIDFNHAVMFSPSAVMEISRQVAIEHEHRHPGLDLHDDKWYRALTEQRICLCVSPKPQLCIKYARSIPLTGDS